MLWKTKEEFGSVDLHLVKSVDDFCIILKYPLQYTDMT